MTPAHRQPSHRVTAIVVIDVAEHRVGLLADMVQQVLRMVSIARLPGAPEGVEGVVDVHGEFVPVIDMRRRLGLLTRPATVTDHLILTRTTKRPVALRVDRAVGFETHDLDDVQSIESPLPTSEHIKGVVRGADGLLVIVDVEDFLSPEESDVLTAALAKVGET